MGNLVTAGRWFFAICLVGLAGQQFYYGDFRPVFIPPWSSPPPGLSFLAYLFSLLLIGVAIVLLFEKKAPIAALALGVIFLALLLFCHLPYEGLVDPYGKHIGSWTNACKELAFSGGAIVLAGSFPPERDGVKKGWFTRLSEGSAPMGSLFFSITMIVFGLDHFFYVDFVKALVPSWIPSPVFWTYFAGIALIGAGSCILLRSRLRLAALLLGIMIFLWLIILHIPRAAMAPVTDRGNELTSVFEALGFSGVAFVMAFQQNRGESS